MLRRNIMKVKENTLIASVYVRERLYEAYGVRVIVNHVVSRSNSINVVFSIDNLPSGYSVIPYGVLEANDVISKNVFDLRISLLIDAYSYGCWSNFKSFLWKSYVPINYKISSLLRFVKFLLIEYRILKNFENIILVSWGDKKYYESLWLTKKFAHKVTVIPNGIEIPERIDRVRTKCDGIFKVGCLSAWNTNTIYPFYMFLNDVWNKLPNKENMELIVAGRGLTDDMINYISRFPHVKIIGSVEKLDEFYDEIDASLVTMVKKCGIINRLLDGFAYQVPVICRPENLLAFKDLPDCCYPYTNVDSFTDAIESIRQNPDLAREKVQKAYCYIMENNNWDNNYKEFDKLI